MDPAEPITTIGPGIINITVNSLNIYRPDTRRVDGHGVRRATVQKRIKLFRNCSMCTRLFAISSHETIRFPRPWVIIIQHADGAKADKRRGERGESIILMKKSTRNDKINGVE